MPNYDVLTDYNSYHGIQTTFNMPKNYEGIKSCTGCEHYKTCTPSKSKPCEEKKENDN